MTETVYMVIDNHKKRTATCYTPLFKTKDYEAFKQYVTKKGLVQ
jgi:hypothetical protein